VVPLEDVPVPGNYDNVGHAELALYRPSTGQWFISDAAANPSSVTRVITFGLGGNYVPVPGAYDATAGNPSIELAVFNTATGRWFVDDTAQRSYQFNPGDIPAPGDYLGTGVTEPAVYRPSTDQWWVVLPGATTPTLLGTFGTQNDIPIDAPYHYRQLSGSKGTVTTLSATGSGGASVAMPLDLGATAQNLSNGSSGTSVINNTSSSALTPPQAKAATRPSSHIASKPRQPTLLSRTKPRHVVVNQPLTTKHPSQLS
jgi:hypothetical protein